MKTCSRLWFLLLAAMALAPVLSAQGPAKPPVALTIGQAECQDPGGKPKPPCRLGDSIMVRFPKLPEWLADPTAKNNTKDLVLVLNGHVMKGLTPIGPANDRNELAFELKLLDSSLSEARENRLAWTDLLAKSKWSSDLNLTVVAGGSVPCCNTTTFKFSAFPSYTWLVALFVAALLIVFVLLSHRSDMLRDGPDIVVDGVRKRRTFSLARCQMAWWFFIILASYNYIWLVIGDHDSLTNGALILMGIAAVTGLGAVVLDASKAGDRPALEKQRAGLTAQMAAVPPPANLDELKRTLDDVNASLARLPPPPAPSEGLFLDILSDNTGVSFHRFQMAGWTVVLGFVFATTVFQSLSMPDFSPTLLGLMGISAGTYIGFKIPDQTK